YRLGYTQSASGVSQLTSLQECVPGGSEGLCKPATRFGYHFESPEFTSEPDDVFPIVLFPGIVFDADGDGDHDLKASGLYYNGPFREALDGYQKGGLKIVAGVILLYSGNGQWAPLVNAGIDTFSKAFGKSDLKYIPPAL